MQEKNDQKSGTGNGNAFEIFTLQQEERRTSGNKGSQEIYTVCAADRSKCREGAVDMGVGHRAPGKA